jgi:hypothetical protein
LTTAISFCCACPFPLGSSKLIAQTTHYPDAKLLTGLSQSSRLWIQPNGTSLAFCYWSQGGMSNNFTLLRMFTDWRWGQKTNASAGLFCNTYFGDDEQLYELGNEFRRYDLHSDTPKLLENAGRVRNPGLPLQIQGSQYMFSQFLSQYCGFDAQAMDPNTPLANWDQYVKQCTPAKRDGIQYWLSSSAASVSDPFKFYALVTRSPGTSDSCLGEISLDPETGKFSLIIVFSLILLFPPMH